MNLFSSFLVFFTLCVKTLGMSVSGQLLRLKEPMARRLSVKEAKSLWRRAPQPKNLLTITLIVGIIGATALVVALILGIVLLVRGRKDRRVSNSASNSSSRRIRLPESTVPTVSEPLTPQLKERPFPASPESPRRPTQAEPRRLDRVEPPPDIKPTERQFNVPRKLPPTPLPTELRRDAESSWYPDDTRRLEGTIARQPSRSRPTVTTTPVDTVSSPSRTRGPRTTPSEPRPSKSSFDRTLPHSTLRGHDSERQPSSPVREPGEPVPRSPPLTPRARQSSLPRTSTRPKLVLPPEPVPALTRDHDVPATSRSGPQVDEDNDNTILLQTPPVSSRFSVSPVAKSFGSRINSPASPSSSSKRHTRLFGSFSRTRRGEGRVPGVPDVPTDVS